MTARDWLEVVVLLLLTANLVVLGGTAAFALKKVSALSERLETTMEDVRRDTVAALQETHETLAKVAKLSESLEQLVRAEVAPTVQVTRTAVGHVETVLRSVSDASAGVRRIVSGAEALTTPATLLDAAGRLIQSPGGKTALAAAGMVAVLRNVLMARSRTPESTEKE